MIKNVKITSENGKIKDVFIEGVLVPVKKANLSFDFCEGEYGVPKLVIENYIKNFEFDGDANLFVNCILLGLDNERRLYQQLKEKYSGTIDGEKV